MWRTRFATSSARVVADRIIAAIVDGAPNSKHECFPEPLKHPVEPDGELDRSQRAEPIAADFRLKDGSEGFTSAEGYRLALQKNPQLTGRQVEQQAEEFGDRLQLMKLKVIAGILGVPMEQLRDRDKAYQLQLAQRRARTLRRWLAAVAMLSVLAIARRRLRVDPSRTRRCSSATRRWRHNVARSRR